MNTILDNLKLYFENNSREEIEKDWAALAKYDEVGPTLNEFLNNSKLIYEEEQRSSPYWEYSCLNHIKNPKFSSDFFYLSASLL